MDIPILIAHLFASLIYLSFSFPQSLLIVIYTAIWYGIIDRLILSALLAIPVRVPLVLFNVKDKVVAGTFWTEILKAPISAALGGYILLHLFKNDSILMPFGIGIYLWSFNFHFVGGVFRNHPLKVPMYIGVFILTTITILLIPDIQ
jgi:hypothetical protein